MAGSVAISPTGTYVGVFLLSGYAGGLPARNVGIHDGPVGPSTSERDFYIRIWPIPTHHFPRTFSPSWRSCVRSANGFHFALAQRDLNVFETLQNDLLFQYPYFECLHVNAVTTLRIYFFILFLFLLLLLRDSAECPIVTVFSRDGYIGSVRFSFKKRKKKYKFADL